MGPVIPRGFIGDKKFVTFPLLPGRIFSSSLAFILLGDLGVVKAPKSSPWYGPDYRVHFLIISQFEFAFRIIAFDEG